MMNQFTANLLEIKQSGMIIKLERNPISLKFLEMGFLPGKEIEIIRKCIFGESVYLRLDNSFFFLRKEFLRNILVQTDKSLDSKSV
jgi:Fe2+ transport system protein FeoA